MSRTLLVLVLDTEQWGSESIGVVYKAALIGSKVWMTSAVM